MFKNTPYMALLLGTTVLAGFVAPSAAFAAEEADAYVFEEIIVTANKREESLRSVAGSISALTGDDLKKMGAQSLSDYITRLPGVHFNDYQPGVSEVVIRGVSSTTYHEQGQTVVGYYINEIPLSEAGWPIVIPDIDTFDLERVEVLRCPQGTLFGSSSLGGLVNYIAREANVSRYDAAFEASFGSTRNAGEANYAVKAMANAPLVTDKLAVRLVALERYEAGHLDNIGTGVDGANDLAVRGARGSVVFTPAEGTKLTWMTMYQETNLDDATYSTFPTLTRNTFVAEPHITEMMLHSIRLEQDIGFADLTVLGALAQKDSLINFDYTTTGYLQGTPTRSDGFGEADSEHFEIRLSSKDDGPLHWLVGAAYYKSDKNSNDAVFQEGAAAYIDANPGLFGGHPGSLLAPNDYFSQYQVFQYNKDYAVFGEISYDLTDELTITAGGRYFDTKSDTTVTTPPSALFNGSFDATGSSFNEISAETGFTPKVSVKYQALENLMLYASYSEGFRVGGANPNPPGATGAPATYAPDTTRNYEVGARVDLMDRRLLLDATVFRIDWTDIQVRLFTPAPLFQAYVTNAGAAEINGLEFSAALRATNSLTFNTSITYLDAEISEFLPDTFAVGGGYAAGTTLPGASKWSVVNSAILNLDEAPLMPRIALSHRYVSKAPVAFGSVAERGGFNLIDARATFQVSQNVDLTLYAENIFDEYGILNAPFADFYPQPLASVTRPRTVGFRFAWTLE